MRVTVRGKWKMCFVPVCISVFLPLWTSNTDKIRMKIATWPVLKPISKIAVISRWYESKYQNLTIFRFQSPGVIPKPQNISVFSLWWIPSLWRKVNVSQGGHCAAFVSVWRCPVKFIRDRRRPRTGRNWARSPKNLANTSIKMQSGASLSQTEQIPPQLFLSASGLSPLDSIRLNREERCSS